MRLTEFWSRMEEHFGSAYAHTIAADYRLPGLGCTVDEAIARGYPTKQVWRAVVAEFDVAAHLR